MKKITPFHFIFVALVVVLVINLFAVHFTGIDTSRTVRIASSAFLFGLAMYYRVLGSSWLWLAIIFLILRDVAILNYESPILKSTSFLMTLAAYVSISMLVLHKLKFKNFKVQWVAFALLLIGLNLFNVYYLSDVVVSGLDNNFQLVLFYLQGAIILFMGWIAYVLFDTLHGRKQLFFLYFVLCFIFSDLSGLAAYFFEFQPAYYVERCFYILGVGLFVQYALLKETSEENTMLTMSKL